MTMSKYYHADSAWSYWSCYLEFSWLTNCPCVHSFNYRDKPVNFVCRRVRTQFSWTIKSQLKIRHISTSSRSKCSKCRKYLEIKGRQFRHAFTYTHLTFKYQNEFLLGTIKVLSFQSGERVLLRYHLSNNAQQLHTTQSQTVPIPVKVLFDKYACGSCSWPAVIFWAWGFGGLVAQGGVGGGVGVGVVMYHLPLPPPPSYLSLNTSVPTSTPSFWCSQVSQARYMEMGVGLKTPKMMMVESTIGRPRSVD